MYMYPQIPPTIGCLKKFDESEFPDTQVKKHGVNGGLELRPIVTENGDRRVEMKELGFLSPAEMPPTAVYYFQEKIAQNPTRQLNIGLLSSYGKQYLH